MKIGDFEATLTHARVGDTTVALWRVAALERHVDRAALLAADEPPEPPYWAHLWSGAVVLAAAVPRSARRVLELGCGLGLPGLTAARRGARVTFVDRVPAALAFVRASARANGLAAVDLVAFGALFQINLLAPADQLLRVWRLFGMPITCRKNYSYQGTREQTALASHLRPPILGYTH